MKIKAITWALKYKAGRFLFRSAAKRYARQKFEGPAKVFGVLAAVTVVATVAYVIATGNGKDEQLPPPD